MSDNKDLEDRIKELEREKLQKHVRELEAELRKKQDKQKKIVLRRIDLVLAAALLTIMCVCGTAYLLRDKVSSMASRIGFPGAPTSTPLVTPTMVFIGGCSAAELQSPEVQAYLAAVNEELANTDPGKIEVFLASVQTAYDNLPVCVQKYVEPFNTPRSLGLTAAAQARDEVDPSSMQNYKDIMSGHMQEAEANISLFNGLSIAYTNPHWVKGPTPTTDPDATPTTGPGSTPTTSPSSTAGGSGPEAYQYWIGDMPNTYYRLNLSGERAIQVTGKPWMIVKYNNITQEILDVEFGVSEVIVGANTTNFPNFAHLFDEINMVDFQSKLGLKSPVYMLVVWDNPMENYKSNFQGVQQISFVYDVTHSSLGMCLEQWTFTYTGESMTGGVTNLDTYYYMGDDSDTNAFKLRRIQ